jgi:hypothetical protein
MPLQPRFLFSSQENAAASTAAVIELRIALVQYSVVNCDVITESDKLQDIANYCSFILHHIFISDPQCLNCFLFTETLPGYMEIYIPRNDQIDNAVD